jgi:hypothetical protein
MRKVAKLEQFIKKEALIPIVQDIGTILIALVVLLTHGTDVPARIALLAYRVECVGAIFSSSSSSASSLCSLGVV